MSRHCARCGRLIERCNGFVLARDLVAFMEGEIEATKVRELCGKCISAVEAVDGEPPYKLRGTIQEKL